MCYTVFDTTRTSTFEAAAVGLGFNAPKPSLPCSSSHSSTVGVRVGLLHTLPMLPYGVELPRLASALDEIFDVEWRVPCLSALSTGQVTTADQSVPPAEEVVPPDHPVLSAEEAMTTEDPTWVASSGMSESGFLASTVESMWMVSGYVDPDIEGTTPHVDDAKSPFLVASTDGLIASRNLPNEEVVATRGMTPSTTCAGSTNVVDQYDSNDTTKPGGRTLAWSDLVDDSDDPYGPIPAEWLQPPSATRTERQPPKVFAIGLMATHVPESDTRLKTSSSKPRRRSYRRAESPREWLRRTVSCEPEEVTANRRRSAGGSYHATESVSNSYKSSYRHSKGQDLNPRDFGRERSLIPEGGWFRASIEPELQGTDGRSSTSPRDAESSDSETSTSSDEEASRDSSRSGTEEERYQRKLSRGASELDKIDHTDHSRSKTQRDSKQNRERRQLRKAMRGVKLTPPPVWDGKPDLEEFDQWVFSVDSYLELTGLDDRLALKIIINFLSGIARRFYMNHVATRQHKWTIKTLYVALFDYCFPTDYKERLRERLMRAKQGSADDVRDFMREIEQLAVRFSDVTDIQLRFIFWDGIHTYLRVYLVEKGLNPEKSSLEKLVKHASRKESSHRAMETHYRRAKKYSEVTTDDRPKRDFVENFSSKATFGGGESEDDRSSGGLTDSPERSQYELSDINEEADSRHFESDADPDVLIAAMGRHNNLGRRSAGGRSGGRESQYYHRSRRDYDEVASTDSESSSEGRSDSESDLDRRGSHYYGSHEQSDEDCYQEEYDSEAYRSDEDSTTESSAEY